MELTAVLTPAEEGGFVAFNPETGTTTQGETVEEAIANLREATALYLSEFPLETKGHPPVTMFSVPRNTQAASNLGRRSAACPGALGIRESASEGKSCGPASRS